MTPREEVINVPEGPIVLRWPADLCPGSLRLFGRWVALLLEIRTPQEPVASEPPGPGGAREDAPPPADFDDAPREEPT